MTDQPHTVDPPEPGVTSEVALELVGNGTRIAILRALWASPADPVSFSTLRERAGIPDSGQFNYHLQALLGSFVDQTDGGYTPLQGNRNVLRAVLAGATDDALPGKLEMDGTCAFCDGELEATYEAEELSVTCRACGKVQVSEWFPPAGVAGRTPEEVVSAFDRWVRHRSALLLAGVCPDCSGSTARTVVETRPDGSGSRDYLRARFVCQTCTYECDIPIWLYVLLTRHPAIVSFFYSHGITLDELPIWKLTSYGHRGTVTLLSETPLHIEVEMPLGDEDLHLTVDEELQIVDAPTVEMHPIAPDD